MVGEVAPALQDFGCGSRAWPRVLGAHPKPVLSERPINTAAGLGLFCEKYCELALMGSNPVWDAEIRATRCLTGILRPSATGLELTY